MCKEEEGLSIKWIFNRTNKFQFGELKKWDLPIKTYKLLTIKLLYSMFLINYYIGAFVWK